MLAIGTKIRNRYEVTGLIGHGGMSNVYSAVHLETGSRLAIKEAIRTAQADEKLAELGLSKEGHLLKTLSNEHLPRIYDIIVDNANILLVMDFVEGQNLNQIIEAHGSMPVESVLEVGIQVCDILSYLHRQDPPIIYRDMKPANLIMKPDGFIMMTDFGTARTWKLDNNRTSDTVLIGTEGFAAPEQYGGFGQSDARTDIFCLGATLFNLITGHSPYSKPMGITPIGNWKPELADSPLDQIISKCTANDPDDRFQTSAELKEALINARDGGKTGFFTNLFKGNNTKKMQGWQTAPMTLANGRSQQLYTKEASANGQHRVPTGSLDEINPRTEVFEEPPFGNSDLKAERYGQGAEKLPNQTTADQDLKEQEFNLRKWRITALLSAFVCAAAVIAGILLAVIDAPVFAIVFIMIALGALILCLVGAVMYIRS